jgi:predicted GNAT superfamily acetyltransferase
MIDVVIRDLHGMAEFRLAEDLQNAVWGKDDTADPADLMMVIQAEGGLCAGAFRDERLIGYVFAFPTREPFVQHSHRLAVLPEARGLHLGARLKWYQRDWCLARGIDLVRWTYDPMRRLNAGLNIATLGAIVRVYYPDYYGKMLGINAGLPSDRLLAEWHLNSPGVAAKAAGQTDSVAAATDLTVALPEDYDALVGSDPARALAERLRLRDALVAAFARGEAIIGFDRASASYRLGRLAE